MSATTQRQVFAELDRVQSEQPFQEDPEDRKRLIGNALTLFILELFFLGCIIFPFIYSENLRDVFKKNHWIFPVSIVASFIAIFVVLFIMPIITTKRPINYIFLHILVFNLGIFMGAVTLMFNYSSVQIAFELTFKLGVVLTVAAFVSPFDITKYRTPIALCTFVAFLSGLMLSYVFTSLCIVTGVIFVIVICTYFVYHCQVIRGHGRYALPTSHHVLAAILLVVDIGVLFLFLIHCDECFKDESTPALKIFKIMM